MTYAIEGGGSPTLPWLRKRAALVGRPFPLPEPGATGGTALRHPATTHPPALRRGQVEQIEVHFTVSRHPAEPLGELAHH